MTVELTVAICTLGRPLSLRQTLETLAGQSWDGAWEVLIVDNDGGASGRLQGAAALAKALPLDLRATVESRRGLSFARNSALAEAQGDAILFTDDDVNCPPGWARGHGETLRDPSVIVLGHVE
jgi:glycosyltransferase involved in cell wall biosynthesis